jgi:transcriptional regulator with XRE-family HTH domain
VSATGDEALGRKLRKLRLCDRIPLKQAARAAGVSVSTMHGYEAGRSMPSVRVLARLAAFYGVSLDRLCRHMGEDTAA